MEVEVISKDNIKPSSPTPHHLKTFKFSLLDQFAVDSYVPLILYYPNRNYGDNILQAQEKSLALKESLSKTLTQFYPLAGTIKNDFYIDCNDVGAYFALALVRRRLDEFLSHPDVNLIKLLLPFTPTFKAPEDARITNVQMNIFECGGIVIGLCISHKIVDLAATHTFLRGWTNMVCGANEVVYPNLTASALFPAKDMWIKEASMAMCRSWIKKGKFSTKRCVFDADAIARLKAEATRNGVKNPTRVEVVTALIWKCAMAASKENCGFQKPSFLTHSVNLRRKLPSSLSKDLIGNALWVTPAEWRDNHDPTFHGLVKKVHESFSKIDIEFVKKAQGDEGYIALQQSIKETIEIGSKGTMDAYVFTSWCKMGSYEIDFGWGKPSWVAGIVGHGSLVFTNVITLMDTKCGEGIEAWVNLDENEMDILSGNSELLAFASLDPSPLQKMKLH
ncbi:hypothetical protein L6452_08117 [Arctium lappa]|uniref:Uncharacterized protein n=1 Tax=Arctium lappa TaxID=4217 RepID=A0ACB9DGU7_ARCLA|nr:hypothetical protein L6452_08117 [Arctium lappa]